MLQLCIKKVMYENNLHTYIRILTYLYFIVTSPLITRQPRSTVVEAGNVAVFECAAVSYGTTSITWKKMNARLPITTSVTTQRLLNEITSVLRIQKTIKYYEGNYYCVIENSVGQVQSSFAYCEITGN